MPRVAPDRERAGVMAMRIRGCSARHHIALLATLLCMGGPAAAGDARRAPFQPDLELRSLDGARQIGRSGWSVRDGVLASPAAGSRPSWLALDRKDQDVEVAAEFRCPDACRLGLLLRAAPAAGKGLTGVLVPVGVPGRPAERVTVDATGAIVERTPLPIGFAARRLASQPPAGAPSVPKPRDNAPPEGTRFPPPDTSLRTGDWNSLAVQFDANLVKVSVNGATVGAWVADADGFGATALLVEAGSRAEFRNIAVRDLARRERKPERVAGQFRKQVLNDFFYGWGAASGDVNRDGAIDIVSGPFIYYGPDFRSFREFSIAEPVNPATDYPRFFEQYVADFTGDGWPDILAVRHAPPFGQLYVNPKGEGRRWEVATVINRLVTETTALADIDGDGRPELLYTVPGELLAARPDPARPTAAWNVETLSREGVGPGGNHGFGVGDVTGDGKPEILTRFGWWERPATAGEPWRYHPQFFGRHGPAGPGGAEIGVHDVNGDGLNDVVTALTAHGYGLAWFEQKRDAGGEISFTQHLIMDGPGGRNAGGVVFSQPHAAKAADINGDGIPDLITGKRYFSHLEGPGDPDTWGEPVLFWYEAVRDRKAPGGARFVPHLIDNRSGVGAQLLATDLDRDGAPDIVAATRFGAAIFWNRRNGD